MNERRQPPTPPSGTSPASPSLLDDVLSCAQSLQGMLDDACPPIPLEQADAELLGGFVDEADEHLDAAELELLRTDAIDLDAVFRAFHTIKGAAGFLQLHPILTLAHATETLLERLRDADVPLTDDAIELVLGSVDQLRLLLVDVRATLAGTPVLTHPGVMRQVRRCETFVPRPGARESAQPERRTADRRIPDSGTVRVNATELDALSDLIARLAGHAPPADGTLGQLVVDLQARCAALRTVRFDSVLHRLQRVAHDTARKVGKDVELIMVGGAHPLDRRLVDALLDPLVQLVRNAVDHGIEAPEQRRAAGKPRVGRIALDLYQHGQILCIELRDDGNGLDVRRLKANAVQRGYLTALQANALSDRAAFDLVFTPGLSTATDVTEISGRGVGMDVVRRNVQNLGGQINVRSHAGVGAVFTLRLPQTPAL